MPQNNRFGHQQYPTTPLRPPEFVRLRSRLEGTVDFSQLHDNLNVLEVILVHGTFLGDDPFAIAEVLRNLGDGSRLLQPTLDALADRLQANTPAVTETITADIGNYTDEFVQAFQQLVADEPQVRRLEPTWSGQNHHLARADLAIRLLCRIAEINPGPDQTVLLWGHSHAGNGFALLTNLLANDRAAVQAFFHVCGHPQQDHWKTAEAILRQYDGPLPWAQAIHIVAFGTPVRYGWDPAGYRSLTHILHHHHEPGETKMTAHPVFPFQSPAELFSARHGDWVQTFGIAGTDVAPGTTRRTHRQLGAFLEASLQPPTYGLDTHLLPTQRLRDACARWKTGTRCHADGLNVLVAYEPSGESTSLRRPLEMTMLGHGVATTRHWLPAHLALVISKLRVRQSTTRGAREEEMRSE